MPAPTELIHNKGDKSQGVFSMQFNRGKENHVPAVISTFTKLYRITWEITTVTDPTFKIKKYLLIPGTPKRCINFVAQDSSPRATRHHITT